MMDQRIADERELRAAVQRASKGSAKASDPWDAIARAEQRQRDILIPYTWLEGGAGFNSQLFTYARLLVRAADERAKPNSSRMREYTDAALPQLRAELEAQTPIAAELEQVRLSFSLERMREYLGPDHAIIKSVLGSASPDERARQLVSGSTLADPAERMKLYDGGQAAVSASKDSLIALARAVDAESRRLRTIYENEVEGPVRRAQQVMDSLLYGVANTRAETAIIDITGVSVVDTQVANARVRAAVSVQLLGARVMITGIRPEVAQTLVGLGVDLPRRVGHHGQGGQAEQQQCAMHPGLAPRAESLVHQVHIGVAQQQFHLEEHHAQGPDRR
jgi:anti-anti-sigma regulatory factor